MGHGHSRSWCSSVRMSGSEIWTPRIPANIGASPEMMEHRQKEKSKCRH